ncbi:hypothetical protein IGS68_29430 (plasmid) [Skermanella sp. TT6]|uniref:HNH endonuclease n=1 Tax=Skermanella cutis TaxID=2775420 RepID=A0ABX7BGH7_9PROT|nr:hypothetical protein [Skermanella sp. TT6]QQP93245.1 hypothetical protein IGS68_29430 [Skermanella sp. TT6]
MPKSDEKRRDDFPQPIKTLLAKRVNFRCSNPECRQPTIGPGMKKSATVSIGVAAHISGAAPNGPRFNAVLTADERKSADNGIWLCRRCDKIIDSDENAYSEELLQDWKQTAEATTHLELKGLKAVRDNQALLRKLESDMPALFAEMRTDLAEHPFSRDFVLIKREWSFNGDPNNVILMYYFNDHPHLRPMVQVLENRELVRNVTHTNVERFRMEEAFVDYLKTDPP